jgi:hypothetical protein
VRILKVLLNPNDMCLTIPAATVASGAVLGINRPFVAAATREGSGPRKTIDAGVFHVRAERNQYESVFPSAK